MRIIATVGIIIGVIALIGWVLTSNKKKNDAKTAVAAQTNSDVAVRTFTVAKQTIEQDFAVNGNFAPIRQMNFASENAGRVVRILVDEGSRVSVGQTLAIIDAGTLNIDLESAEANLQNALRDRYRDRSR